MKEIAHLFSGGTDSTYTVTLLVKLFDRINLVTYERLGLHNVNYALVNYEKLKKMYGPNRINISFMNIDKEFRALCYNNYFSDLMKYGIYNLMNCGLCKLAMHWRTIIYCLDNNIKYVACGANPEIVWDPSQHLPAIQELRNLYESFGIQYFTPAFDTLPDEREKTLYEIGISKYRNVKWTLHSWEIQHTCYQEYLQIMLAKYASRPKLFSRGNISRAGDAEYQKKMLEFFKAKMEEVRGYVTARNEFFAEFRGYK
jgi:hypothetical protein